MSKGKVSLGDILSAVIDIKPLELAPEAKILVAEMKEKKIGITVAAEEILRERRINLAFDGFNDLRKFVDGGFLPKLQALFPDCHTLQVKVASGRTNYMNWSLLRTLRR
jgi:hypothetical protein